MLHTEFPSCHTENVLLVLQRLLLWARPGGAIVSSHFCQSIKPTLLLQPFLNTLEFCEGPAKTPKLQRKQQGDAFSEITPKEELIWSWRYEILILALLKSQLCSRDILGEILLFLCSSFPTYTTGTRMLTSIKHFHAKVAKMWALSDRQKDKKPCNTGSGSWTTLLIIWLPTMGSTWCFKKKMQEVWWQTAGKNLLMEGYGIKLWRFISLKKILIQRQQQMAFPPFKIPVILLVTWWLQSYCMFCFVLFCSAVQLHFV